MEQDHAETPNRNFCQHYCSTRYLLSILASVGFGLLYGHKVNLNVLIISMINRTAVQIEVNRSRESHGHQLMWNRYFSQNQEGEYVWSGSVKGMLLSSYYWGYMVGQLPGGRMAELFSSKWVLNASLFFCAVPCLLIPICAELHYVTVLIMRIIQGFAGGMAFPAMHVMLSFWSPLKERSTMSSIVYSGTGLGTVLFIYASGLIAWDMGWAAAYYLEGIVTIIWCACWGIYAADSPGKMRFISKAEREYIESETTGVQDNHSHHLKVPWKTMWFSLPFWAIMVTHVLFNFAWYTFLVELPTYMTHVLGLPLGTASLYSSLPYLALWVFSNINGAVLTKLQKKGKISVTVARKIATTTCCMGPGICLLLLPFFSNQYCVLVLAMIGVATGGGMFCGFLCNHIDIAPNFAGTLLAITNTAATVGGIISPMVISMVTEHYHENIWSWRVCFMVIFVFDCVATAFYLVFGSGELQPWNSAE